QHRAQRLFGPHQLPPEPHQRQQLQVGDEPADDCALIDSPEKSQRRPAHESRQHPERRRRRPDPICGEDLPAGGEDEGRAEHDRSGERCGPAAAETGGDDHVGGNPERGDGERRPDQLAAGVHQASPAIEGCGALGRLNRAAYQAAVRARPSRTETAGAYPRIRRARPMSASECRTSPARKGRWRGTISSAAGRRRATSARISRNSSLSVVRPPYPMFKTWPRAAEPAVVAASRFAWTTLSTKQKSRLVSPSPKMATSLLSRSAE